MGKKQITTSTEHQTYSLIRQKTLTAAMCFAIISGEEVNLREAVFRVKNHKEHAERRRVGGKKQL